MGRPPRLIVCVNERLGSGQRSCVGSGNLDYIRRVRQMLADARLDVPVVERECLGHCDAGPVMRIAPGGCFYTEIDDACLARIVAELQAALDAVAE